MAKRLFLKTYFKKFLKTFKKKNNGVTTFSNVITTKYLDKLTLILQRETTVCWKRKLDE